MITKRKNPALLLLATLFALNILAWLAVYDFHDKELEIIFFDVGQGDAALIKTPLGHHILIDGGPDSSILEKLGKEMPFWKRSVDLIIMTHPHEDHFAGFIEILKRYHVKNIMWTGVLADTALFKEWQELIDKERANIYIAEQGQLIYGGSAVLKILHPFDSFENQKVQNMDNTSVVVKVLFGENNFLFTGDAFRETERDLVRRGINLTSNVLQVGHHGSRTSSVPEFVAAVLPELAVISAGKDNRNGHPHEETLETLADYDITVLRTDELGNIKVISNGSQLVVKF